MRPTSPYRAGNDRSLYITEAGAVTAARKVLEEAGSSSKVFAAEVVPGLLRNADRSIERGWFVRIAERDGRTGYL